MPKISKHDIYIRAIENTSIELQRAERVLQAADKPLSVWAAMEVMAKMEKIKVLSRLAEGCAKE